LFIKGFVLPCDLALFGIGLFTGCQVSEALASQTLSLKLSHNKSAEFCIAENNRRGTRAIFLPTFQ
jgi:hypothetical protein